MNLAVREAFRAFNRAPMLSALSVTTIAFSLFAFGLFGLVAVNMRAALDQVEERVEIRGFVAAGTAPEATSAAVGDIAAFPEVGSVRLVTEVQALERARRELGEFQDVFEAGILPASIEVRLREGYRDPETVRTIARRFEAYDFIDDIRYGEEWVEKLYNMRNIATAVGITLGLIFAGVAVIIIGSTIRMAVLARSREIHIMRLVGATDGFIRAPFLIEGFLKGLLGGLLALALTYVTYTFVGQYLVQATYFEPALAVFGVLAGALIGLLGSAVSVGRHLRRV
ncbi:MAG: ABC transporter permease [Gemmatimonadales bacterium]|nr:ABC transporter permease [Gemmatimonadota bacterium]MCL4214533.1 ABC transporter permease [Gemmatimonadales bacterium]